MLKPGDYLSINDALKILPVCRRTLYNHWKKYPELMRKFEGRTFVSMKEAERILRQDPHRKKPEEE